MSSHRRTVQTDDDRWLGAPHLCAMDPGVSRQGPDQNGANCPQADQAAPEPTLCALRGEDRRMYSVVSARVFEVPT
jgi:hypothetical protein